MKRNALISCVLTAGTFSSTMPAGQTPSPIPLSRQISSDTEIRQILVDQIDGQHQSLGIVVLATRMTGPLKMTSTAVTVTPEMRPRLATGHDAQRKTAARWNVPALVGGGSLHSSAEDLLTFLAALGDTRSAVAAVVATMLDTRRPAPGFQQALGWMVLSNTSNDEILFHDGQTLGFASSIAYDPTTRTGVVVLSNTAAGVGDIARHLLRSTIPLAKPAAPAPVYRSCACARKAKPISLSQRTPEFPSPSRSTLAIRLHGCC